MGFNSAQSPRPTTEHFIGSRSKPSLLLVADDQMGTLDGAGEVITISGDFQRGYYILDGKVFSIQRLSELYAEAGLVGFKVHARVGGYSIRPSNKALVLLTEHA